MLSVCVSSCFSEESDGAYTLICIFDVFIHAHAVGEKVPKMHKASFVECAL